ncbi:helix-turn-helix transcriptional regulator [Streptomyces sp. DG2A-72]|uniref:helix-turn-helix transcriptional regulator n=1 Tax=Streptomyces sp. DG2A-72 TaxID=3051386 RepID=UPI00265C02C1|nr:helix-turn-helix transcriptional regulator [Streptomyces sp. DG2A-72]MDO0933456.1 helix-turn-helix transcriptional regulator [Streptomyces sp. DG2A-72]
MDTGEDFGPWLARQLRRSEMNQADLAEQLGLTRAAVSAWITGRATPREETMRAIAEVFRIDHVSVHTRTTDVVSSRPVSWYHRPAYADGGRDFGNAATFAFEADVEILAREATQNSLDERLDRTKPVRVRYTLHELTGESLARFREAVAWDDLFPHYEAAAAQEQKVGRVIAEGLRDMYERDRLILLRVDDYNASGLTGDDYEDGRFAAVVRRQLDSRKSDASAGGSYGLGKATLWAASRLGMVLINSTLSVPHEGRTERRLIGRLELPWRVVDDSPWAGPAWFGEPDTAPGSEEVARSWWADEETVERLHLTRESSAPGTSFLIVGAHDVASLADDSPSGEDAADEETVQSMHERLVQALGRNFWAAMTAGRDKAPLLEASVRTVRNGKVVIDEERVEPRKEQPSRTRALKAYLDGETVDRLTETGQVAEMRVPLKVPPRRGQSGGAVEHEAVLLITSAEDLDGKPNQMVAMRGNRMVIRSARVPDLPLGTNPFQAVLLTGHAAGDDADNADRAEAFLRASEPPEHNKWGQTDELRALYSATAHRRISEFTRAANTAVRDLVGRSREKSKGGSHVLRDLLGLETGTTVPTAARGGKVPAIRGLDAELDASGAWRVRAEVKLPVSQDPWLLLPVAKFDVRSGGRPSVGWAEIVAGQNCELVEGRLRFKAGARTASFSALTDVSTHPVRAELAGLIVELQKSREISA